MIRAACVAIALAASPAAAECVTAPEAAIGGAQLESDRAGRAIAPVFVNGQGPFRFVVDTGANRSVLSGALAQRLGITPRGAGEVHSVTGVEMAPFARVADLALGDLSIADADLPVLSGPMLAGEQGLLGFDGMRGLRLQIDFARRCVEVVDPATAPPLTGWRSARGQVRFGSLMVVRGDVQGVPVNVLIDTGADISLANTAFRTALGRVRAQSVNYHGGRAYTAGRPLFFEDTVWAPRVRLDHTMMSNVTAALGDYHIFTLWGLEHEPTLLVGMDVLAQSEAMAIDYSAGIVYFRRPPRGA